MVISHLVQSYQKCSILQAKNKNIIYPRLYQATTNVVEECKAKLTQKIAQPTSLKYKRTTQLDKINKYYVYGRQYPKTYRSTKSHNTEKTQ